MDHRAHAGRCGEAARVALLALACLTACSPERSVIVQLTSNMVPGREVDLAEVTLSSGGRVLSVQSTELAAGRSLARTVRVAAFPGLGGGSHQIDLVLRRGSTVVQRRRVTRNVEGVTVVTVLLTRDCVGIMCPAVDGDPASAACLGGRCVPEDCDEEHRERCLAPACTSDADCPASGIACAPSRCSSSGACFASPDDTLCADGGTCDTVIGCVPRTPARCGDGNIDPGEACDGSNLGGFTCASVAAGFIGGSLACEADCSGYQVLACTRGTTRTADSCSQVDVAAAIAASADGDTVQIPPGRCAWTSAPGTAGLVVEHGVVLRGAGEGPSGTVLVDETGITSAESMLIFGGVAEHPFRVTNLSIERPDATDTDTHVIAVYGAAQNWRVDHCTFSIGQSDGAVFVGDAAFGVVDHATFRGTAAVWVFGPFGMGASVWDEPLSLGTRRAVFVEDSTFEGVPGAGGAALYADDAARYVFRDNTVTEENVYAFGATYDRGTFSSEVYGNRFLAGTWVPVSFGGGSGVVWGNTIVGDMWASFLLVENTRSCEDTTAGGCNGSSERDGNGDASGYPCLDQLGRSTDASATSPHPQALAGLYEWDNTLNDADLDLALNPGRCALMSRHLVEGRDFFNDTPRPGYVPFAYPHPVARIEP